MKKTFKEYIIQLEVLIDNHKEIYFRLEEAQKLHNKDWNEVNRETVQKIVQDVFVDLNQAKIYLQLLKANIPMRDDEENYFEVFTAAMASVYKDLDKHIPKFK